LSLLYLAPVGIVVGGLAIVSKLDDRRGSSRRNVDRRDAAGAAR
jgi:hypothetical protein